MEPKVSAFTSDMCSLYSLVQIGVRVYSGLSPAYSRRSVAMLGDLVGTKK